MPRHSHEEEFIESFEEGNGPGDDPLEDDDLKEDIPDEISEDDFVGPDWKIIILGESGCPSCAEVKESLAKELKSGKYRYVEIDTPESQVFEEQFTIEEIPFFIGRDPKTGKYIQMGLAEDEDGHHGFYREG